MFLRRAYSPKVGAVPSARDVSDHPEITSIHKCVLCPCTVACRTLCSVKGFWLCVACWMKDKGEQLVARQYYVIVWLVLCLARCARQGRTHLYSTLGRDSAGGITTALGDWRSGFESRRGQAISVFFKTSRLALGPTQLFIQEVLGVFPSRGMELTIHFHVAPELRMGGIINLLPVSAFIAWTSRSL
jgi:hypothetical protein